MAEDQGQRRSEKGPIAVGSMEKLYHLKIKKKDISSRVIMPGDPGRTAYIASRYLERTTVINRYRGLDSFTGFYNGTRVSVVTSGMGAPSAGIVTEELKRLGVRIIIRTGTCGGVSRLVKPGDIVVPTGAGSLIGFKEAYGIGEIPSVPDFQVLRSLVQRAEMSGSRFHTGPIMTSDAFFSEKTDAGYLESKGILAMEMECAALFALGHVLGVRTGAVLLATGNINYTQQVMDTPRIRSSLDVMLEIALDTLTS